MIVDDEKDTLAAEYVLGTLDPDERAEAQALIAIDQGFAVIVARWERRLGELNALVAPVEPPPHLWDKVKTLVAGANQSGDVKLPEVDSPPAPAAEPSGEAQAVAAGPAADASAVAAAVPAAVAESPAVVAAAAAAGPAAGAAPAPAVARGGAVARIMASFMTLVALGLAGLIGLREVRPDLLPPVLRPTPVVKTVEVLKTVEVPSPRPAQFVSVLQKDPFTPAFLLTFDMDRKLFSVRAVGADRLDGRAYELWLISTKSPRPQSLGIIGAQEFTIRPARSEWDSTTLAEATYGISLEPKGGSSNGLPSGPMIFSGKLLQTTPPGFPVQTP